MKTQATNSRECTMSRWRSRSRFEAYGIILATDLKMISNKMLAMMLDMDSRGLRQVLERDEHFLITLLGGNHRTEPWYSINPNHPPLVLEKKSNKKVMKTIVGGDILKLAKGKS